jgi:phenylalanyl-tRNA synthetase beta subunit
VPLANPLSAELAVMRPSLLPGLVATLGRNAARQLGRVRLFELGRVFAQQAGTASRHRWKPRAWPLRSAARRRRCSGACRPARSISMT